MSSILVDEGLYEGEISTPKTQSGVRSLPMSRVLFGELQRWHGKRAYDPAELVFRTAVGTPYCRRNLTNPQLKPAAESAGIGAIGWHVLRRTHSTWLKDVGAAPGVISAPIGTHGSASRIRALCAFGSRRAPQSCGACIHPTATLIGPK